MLSNREDIRELSIEELLDHNNSYAIPIYQRNFAWGESEITQLIQDVIDYLPKENNYYLGTLVVFERKDGGRTVYETVDGQQRLTTLSILASVIKNHFSEIDMNWYNRLNLDFDSRSISTKTLEAAYYGNFENKVDYNESIKNAYELTKKILRQKLEENDFKIEEFCDYFFQQVKILRVPLPESTELNHYFEIMNNRGEQLEKHEVLKSKMLDAFNTDQLSETEKKNYKKCFHLIWEACSNMEKYIQYGFSVSQRNSLFGKNDWNSLQANNFDQVCELLEETIQNPANAQNLSISEILEGKTIELEERENEEVPDRFNSVINFPNFLLHVLKVQLQQDEISLDDKSLIEIFEIKMKEADSQIQFVKTFAFSLLKSKFLFDKYVIKREFIAGKDRWSLKRLKWYKDNKVSYVNSFGDNTGEDEEVNRRILMLLAMFHVSTPTLVYKHWLNAVLNYLFYSSDINSDSYIHYLESLGKAFVFDRAIAENPKEYFTIIFENEGVIQNDRLGDLDLSKLRFGNITNNLVFNYLDYLLWRDYDGSDQRVKDFEFTFRSSVDHYYPQNPLDGQRELDKEYLNDFGNLCLISHSKNSRLSNLMPSGKKDYYNKNILDSLKQYEMMNYQGEWNEKAIEEHGKEMKKLLVKQLTD